MGVLTAKFEGRTTPGYMKAYKVKNIPAQKATCLQRHGRRKCLSLRSAHSRVARSEQYGTWTRYTPAVGDRSKHFWQRQVVDYSYSEWRAETQTIASWCAGAAPPRTIYTWHGHRPPDILGQALLSRFWHSMSSPVLRSRCDVYPMYRL